MGPGTMGCVSRRIRPGRCPLAPGSAQAKSARLAARGWWVVSAPGRELDPCGAAGGRQVFAPEELVDVDASSRGHSVGSGLAGGGELADEVSDLVGGRRAALVPGAQRSDGSRSIGSSGP